MANYPFVLNSLFDLNYIECWAHLHHSSLSSINSCQWVKKLYDALFVMPLTSDEFMWHSFHPSPSPEASLEYWKALRGVETHDKHVQEILKTYCSLPSSAADSKASLNVDKDDGQEQSRRNNLSMEEDMSMYQYLRVQFHAKANEQMEKSRSSSSWRKSIAYGSTAKTREKHGIKWRRNYIQCLWMCVMLMKEEKASTLRLQLLQRLQQQFLPFSASYEQITQTLDSLKRAALTSTSSTSASTSVSQTPSVALTSSSEASASTSSTSRKALASTSSTSRRALASASKGKKASEKGGKGVEPPGQAMVLLPVASFPLTLQLQLADLAELKEEKFNSSVGNFQANKESFSKPILPLWQHFHQSKLFGMTAFPEL